MGRHGVMRRLTMAVSNSNPMKTDTMKTIETIPNYLLAEHLGSIATREEADAFRQIAIERGYGETPINEVPNSVWLSLINEMLTKRAIV